MLFITSSKVLDIKLESLLINDMFCLFKGIKGQVTTTTILPKSRNRNSQPPEIIKIYHHNSTSCQKAVSTSMNMP
jgi:hypothetical protein